MQKLKSIAFTLIELLVVITIIGILSTLVLVSISNAKMKANDTKRISNLREIRNALSLYYEEQSAYPPSPCGYNCNNYYGSFQSTWDTALGAALQPYISQMPKDPVNTASWPWNQLTPSYSYSYGNVTRNYIPTGSTTKQPDQYDLSTRLQDKSSTYRCSVNKYHFYLTASNPWCGPYPGEMYEASPW